MDFTVLLEKELPSPACHCSVEAPQFRPAKEDVTERTSEGVFVSQGMWGDSSAYRG